MMKTVVIGGSGHADVVVDLINFSLADTKCMVNYFVGICAGNVP